MFDINSFDNPQKASTYIYKAFENDFNSNIDETLKDNVSRINLLDMLTFDRVDFEKNINLNSKKKVKIESKYKLNTIGKFLNKDNFVDGYAFKSENFSIKQKNDKYLPVLKIGNIISNANSTNFLDCQYHNKDGFENRILEKGDLAIAMTGATVGKAGWVSEKCLLNQRVFAIKNYDDIKIKYLSNFIFSDYFYQYAQLTAKGNAQGNISAEEIRAFKLPLPPLDIQQKIVDEIEKFEHTEIDKRATIDSNLNTIDNLLLNLYNNANNKIRLSNDEIFNLSIGKRVLNAELSNSNTIPVYSANTFEPFGYIDKLLITDFSVSSVIWGIDGDWMVNTIEKNIKFYPTDHCGVIRLKKSNILEEKYLAFALNEEGRKIGFSRTKRASLDRISGITIPLPDFIEQQKIVSQIEELEKQIAEAQAIIDNSKQQKQEILDKYLK